MDRLERPRPRGKPVAASENWLALDRSPHAVHFYSSKDFLLDSLSGFVGTALEAGDSCVVLATQVHLDGLAERLSARGVDTDAVVRQGRYITLDALQVRSRMILDGKLNKAFFDEFRHEILLPLLAAAQSKPPRVVGCGEIVALLWGEGKADIVIEIENFWNELAKQGPFSFRCFNPLTSFADPGQNELFLKLCEKHASVIPPKSHSAPGEEDRLADLAARVGPFEEAGSLCGPSRDK